MDVIHEGLIGRLEKSRSSARAKKREQEMLGRIARERNEKLQNPEFRVFSNLTPGQIKRQYGVSINPWTSGEIYINTRKGEIRSSTIISGKRYPVKGIRTSVNPLERILLGHSCGPIIDENVATEAYDWVVGSVKAVGGLSYEGYQRGHKIRKGLVLSGALALTLAGMILRNSVVSGRSNLEEMITPTPIVYQTPSPNEQSEELEVVATPSQDISPDQKSIIRIPKLDNLGYTYDVDSVCEILTQGDIYYAPGGDVAFSGVPQPKWVVDIKRLHAKDGLFCEGGYEIWAEIEDEAGIHPELENGWFKVRDAEKVYALCGEWLLKGKSLQALVNTYLEVYPKIGNIQDLGNSKYSISFNSKDEALLWVYILSEGNYDPSIESTPQPYQQQQYDVLDGALLNIIQDDMRIHGDGVEQRLKSGRYHGVLYGDPFYNLYIQALNHWENVTVDSASIDPERAKRVLATISLSPQVITEEGLYSYIINPPRDGLNMVENFAIPREALVGPVGLQCFGRK